MARAPSRLWFFSTRVLVDGGAHHIPEHVEFGEGFHIHLEKAGIGSPKLQFPLAGGGGEYDARIRQCEG